MSINTISMKVSLKTRPWFPLLKYALLTLVFLQFISIVRAAEIAVDYGMCIDVVAV